MKIVPICVRETRIPTNISGELRLERIRKELREEQRNSQMPVGKIMSSVINLTKGKKEKESMGMNLKGLIVGLEEFLVVESDSCVDFDEELDLPVDIDFEVDIEVDIDFEVVVVSTLFVSKSSSLLSISLSFLCFLSLFFSSVPFCYRIYLVCS